MQLDGRPVTEWFVGNVSPTHDEALAVRMQRHATNAAPVLKYRRHLTPVSDGVHATSLYVAEQQAAFVMPHRTLDQSVALYKFLHDVPHGRSISLFTMSRL
jgi:hypothetical protein